MNNFSINNVPRQTYRLLVPATTVVLIGFVEAVIGVVEVVKGVVEIVVVVVEVVVVVVVVVVELSLIHI